MKNKNKYIMSFKIELIKHRIFVRVIVKYFNSILHKTSNKKIRIILLLLLNNLKKGES